MAEAVINSTFTFQVLFLDEVNQPLVVLNPNITIFRFGQDGVKSTLVNAAVMTPVAPAEAGRYIYAYLVPSVLNDGDTLYGEMKGTDPGSGLLLVVEKEVSVIASTRAGGGYQGLVARFVGS